MSKTDSQLQLHHRQRKRIGYYAFTVARKQEHDAPVSVNRTWMKYTEEGEFPDTELALHIIQCMLHHITGMTYDIFLETKDGSGIWLLRIVFCSSIG